jgi:hypothetical protein
LQAETATTAVPELDYDALAEELDRKSPLEIMDHVRLPQLFYKLLLFLTLLSVLANGLQLPSKNSFSSFPSSVKLHRSSKVIADRPAGTQNLW